MSTPPFLAAQFRVRQNFLVRFLVIVVGLHGMFIVTNVLLYQVSQRHGAHVNDIVVDIPLLIGLGLIYLSTLLRRRKQTAWAVTMFAYTLYVGLALASLTLGTMSHEHLLRRLFSTIVLPLAIVGMLYMFRKEFIVRSDLQGFRSALRFSAVILLVALCYGVAGYNLMDESDFHQEIEIPTAIHYTIDQFDLTTDKPLRSYTRRAHLFDDSLTFVSIVSVGYAVISLFQPLRSRFSDQSNNRQKLLKLLNTYSGLSEDYFKVWPHDKQYFFDSTERAGLAFHVSRGVALCVGDPVGDRRRYKALLQDFSRLCYSNDWTPAFVHIEARNRKLYESQGFTMQRIGQEAVIDIERFLTDVKRNKYFRQINNKFTKQGYATELLLPPHHDAVIRRLQAISNEWLESGGHVERGFAMGYFTTEYMQQCPVMIVRDAAGTIQAFLNQLPAEFDTEEATYDLLRNAHGGLGNANDFLLLGFIDVLQSQGYKRLNLGLCPLSGLNAATDDQNLIDGVLRFAYANGDKLYSFSGLYRFKKKYQPEWRDRFIAHRGGIAGFSRASTALMRTMSVKL